MRYLFLIFMLCFLSAGCTTTGLPPLTEDLSLEKDEQMLWLQAEEEQAVLEGSGIIYEDQELEDYLSRIVRKLQPPEIHETFNFRLRIIKDPHLNAFAFPNGVIYVHTGILARLDNEAQFAALIAHEMTHCTRRHTLRAFRVLKNHKAIPGSQRKAMARSGKGENLLAFLGKAGSKAAVTGYSQKLETEADTVGLELMSKAGYEPSEALRLFEHLKHEVDTQNIKTPFLFGTHPRLQKRMDNYKDFLYDLKQDKRQGIKNRGIFLERIQKVVLYNTFLDLKAGRFSAAQRGAEKYLMIRPDDARAFFLLGEIYRQKGETGKNLKAKEFYGKAISMDPSYADPHRAVGLIDYKEGECMLAKRSFESYLALSHQPPDRAYIERYLEKCNIKGGIGP
jgi:predicted Zn-dependent protease